jgi:hypothetical protein
MACGGLWCVEGKGIGEEESFCGDDARERVREKMPMSIKAGGETRPG